MTKFPERSEKDQKLYDQVIHRLLAEESPKELAKQFNCSVNKLRNWKSRAKKKIEKLKQQGLIINEKLAADAPASQETAITTNSIAENAPNTTQKTEIELDNIASETLRSFLGDQAVEAITAISLMRDKIPQTLSALNHLILSSIQGLTDVLEAGTAPRTATFQGEIHHQEIPLTVQDRAQIAHSLKALRHEFAALNNLPSEPLKIANLEQQTKQLAAAQHIHLHSHGSRNITPKAVTITANTSEVINAEVIEVEPKPAKPLGPDLEDWQKDLINS